MYYVYIYIRSTPYNNPKLIVLLGITDDIKKRESEHISDEVMKEHFIAMYKIKLDENNKPKISLDTIDMRLMNDCELSKYRATCLRAYTNDIIDILEERLNIYIPGQFDKLSQDEIDVIEFDENVKRELLYAKYNKR